MKLRSLIIVCALVLSIVAGAGVAYANEHQARTVNRRGTYWWTCPTGGDVQVWNYGTHAVGVCYSSMSRGMFYDAWSGYFLFHGDRGDYWAGTETGGIRLRVHKVQDFGNRASAYIAP